MYPLLLFYGFFLIVCSITAVIFIGPKAKTALLSGGTSGILAILIGYFYSCENLLFNIAGLLLPSILFIVFCWRASKTFMTLIDMISTQHAEAKKKGIAFLIISLMAVISLMIIMLQL